MHWAISAAFYLPARCLTFLSQQEECDCREKEERKEKRRREGDSTEKNPDRERVLKWSCNCDYCACTVLTVLDLLASAWSSCGHTVDWIFAWTFNHLQLLKQDSHLDLSTNTAEITSVFKKAWICFPIL
ncbi:hypothetical protein CHARACLAT_022023 [Characodon lateralis]|uniref:Uncharacterized protein n=1 Tax=Characodon lateralis TaxID=208331 RepID=A0ABU7DIW5_9TELE|nr:hypothetical protein [Characodon lateralis]